jgi:RNA polymerase sigma-70 factor, ECF subfamily
LQYQETATEIKKSPKSGAMDSHQHQLMQGLKSGDRKVFETIFNTYYDPLVRYCMQRVYSQEDAEEIAQDIFIKLWVKRNELLITTSLQSYLYRTALNKVINYKEHHDVRKAHREHVLATSSDESQEAALFSTKEIQLLAAEAVSNMPKKRRQVYELSRRDGLTYAEIAGQMGIAVKTVEAHLTAALEQLRNHLKDYLSIIILSTGFWF